eukprot:1020929-Pyramimonas_sp.AAC.1
MPPAPITQASGRPSHRPEGRIRRPEGRSRRPEGQIRQCLGGFRRRFGWRPWRMVDQSYEGRGHIPAGWTNQTRGEGIYPQGGPIRRGERAYARAGYTPNVWCFPDSGLYCV